MDGAMGDGKNVGVVVAELDDVRQVLDMEDSHSSEAGSMGSWVDTDEASRTTTGASSTEHRDDSARL